MAVEKTNSSSSLAEVIDRILDKGIVIDAWARVSLVGIELLAIEARKTLPGFPDSRLFFKSLLSLVNPLLGRNSL